MANIWTISHDPVTAAKLMCDEHIVTCSRDYTQFLFDQHNTDKSGQRIVSDGQLPFFTDFDAETKIWLTGASLDDPCSKWVGECSDNYRWMLALLMNVWTEHHRRFGRIPVAQGRFGIAGGKILDVPSWMPSSKTSGMTTPPQLLPQEFQLPYKPGAGKLLTCVDAYVGYYKFMKGTWTHTDEPKWMVPSHLRTIDPDYVGLTSIGDIEQRTKDAEEWAAHKAAVDAKFGPPPKNKKTFKRIY